jgi:hypothetical protein
MVYAAVSAGLVTVGGLGVGQLKWSHHALWGFFAGFSETFFLGIVKRLTLSNGEAPPTEPPRSTKESSSSTGRGPTSAAPPPAK